MTDDTPDTGSDPKQPPAPIGPDQTLPMNLNAGHGKPDPLADATIVRDLNVKPSAPRDEQDDLATQAATVQRKAAALPPGSSGPDAMTLEGLAADAGRLGDTAATIDALAATRQTAGSERGSQQTLVIGETPQSGSFSRGVSRGLSRSAWTGRVGRTKLNANLAVEAQHLDAKLQISRPSVLADMAAVKGLDALPIGIAKLIDEQGTEGRYAINRELAHGGMGSVLHIEDHDFRRTAAMKVMLSRFADSPEALERFLAEAQVTAQLEHPNIVPIHDMGVMDDGTLYFTMKLIEGVSLGKVVKLLQQQAGTLVKDGKRVEPDQDSAAAAATWTEEEKLQVFLKVLDGIGFAHSRGVVHRDIKPDNIMLGSHGEVLVVDWGIAKVLAVGNKDHPLDPLLKEVESVREQSGVAGTMMGSAMGTIYYMPPEQATGDLDHIDARSDVYALGATLYELLSLKRSMQSKTMPEMILQIVDGDITPIEKVLPSIDPDLAAIVRHAMARERERRYASCAAFSEDLRRYLSGQAVAARKRSIGELIRQWIAQHRRQLQLSGVAVALVTAAIVGTSMVVTAQNRVRAQSLYSEAQTAFAAAGQTPSVEQLAPIREKLASAQGLLPSDPRIQQLKDEVMAAGALAKKRDQEAQQRIADEQSVQKLVQQAQVEQGRGNFVAAEQILEQAVRLSPDESLRRTLIDVGKLAQDVRMRERRAAANAHFEKSRAALAGATAKPPLGEETATLMELVQSELTLASADKEIPLAGLPEFAQAIAAQKRRMDEAARDADNLRRAGEQSAIAAAALAKDDTAAAITAAERAIGFAPNDASTKAVYARAVAAKSTADALALEQRRRQDAEAAAAKLLATAKQAQAEMNRQLDIFTKSRGEVDALAKSLVDRHLDEKKPMFAKMREARRAREALVQAWAACEGAAQNVLATLAPYAQDPGKLPPTYLAGRAILSELYHNRLLEAKQSRSQPDIAAYRNLLKRVDDGTYAGELADKAKLTVTGIAGATIMARRLIESDADTHLVPDGEPLPIQSGAVMDLAAGTWQLTAADTIISLVLTSEAPTVVAWPQTLRSIPGLPLRYVSPNPQDPAAKAFMLGVTEVTIGQYLEFLKDPQNFQAIKKMYKEVVRAADPDSRVVLPHVPTDRTFAPVLVKLVGKPGEESELLDIRANGPLDQPVSLIARDDARDFCSWLSKKHGVTARLPLKNEWQFAANGGDIARVYPWGSHFDGEFAVSSGRVVQKDAAKVKSAPIDCGPFGHYDLAGNLREWLGDVNTNGDRRAAGANGGLIAGGSWSDDAEFWFRATYSESLDPTLRNATIGFRVLVELP